MKNSSSYWDNFIVSNEKLIHKLIYQRCPGQPELREDILSHIHEKLFEDNRRRLRLYSPTRGGSRLTYFCTVINRLISGYFQNRFGRFRPPKQLAEQDDFLMILIYRHLCFERMRKTDLIEYLKNSVPGKRKQTDIEKKINVVLEQYPTCGQTAEVEVDLEDAKVRSEEMSQESKMMASHWSDVFQLILPPQSPPSETEENPPLHHRKLKLIQEQLNLHFRISADKRLFLRMIYQDGMTITAAGKQVGWNKNQSTSQHRRLLKKLKDILEEHF